MQTKIITTTEEFYNLEDNWKGLQKQDTHATYYSTFEYLKAWWQIYKDDNNSLFIICVYWGKKIIAIAPLRIEKVKRLNFSYNSLKFLGVGDYFNFIYGSAEVSKMIIIKIIFKEIFKSDKWERIQLTHIDSRSSLAYFLLRNNEYNKEFTHLVECPVVNLNNYDNFDEYKKTFSIDRETKVYINGLNKKVSYKFSVVKNNEMDVYDKISTLHIMEQEYLVREKNRNDRSSLFNDALYSKFVKDIYKQNPNVITFALEDNNLNLINYFTGYWYKNTIHLWNTAYDPKYEKYNLSAITLYEMFKYLFQNKIKCTVDYGAGRYPWKFKWTKEFITDYKLDLWNESTKKGRWLKALYMMQCLGRL